MRLAEKIVIDIETLEVESRLGEYDYPDHLPVDRCDRGTSKQVAQTSLANEKQDQANAQGALAGNNAAITSFQQSVADFNAKNPYNIGGEYQTAQRTINADTSNAGTNSLNDAMRLNAQRTGQNDASYAPALAEAQRTAARDQATREAQAEETRLADQAKYNAQGVQFASMTPDMYNRIYGTSVSGANGAGGVAGSAAASSPSFLDTLGGSFASTLGKTLGGGNVSVTKAI